jgi:hypothetical protein
MDTIQGGYEVMNLKTGLPLYRYMVKEIPMPPHAIPRVERLAANQGFAPHAEPIFRTYALFAGVDDPQNSDSDEEDYQDDSDGEDDSYNEDIEQEELNEIDNHPRSGR